MYTLWISVVFLHNTGTMDRHSVGHKSNVMLCLLVETLQWDSPSKQKILIFKWHTFAYVNTRKTSLEIHYTGRFIMFSVITNIYNKKTKEPTLMELFTATGKLKKFFFFWQLEIFGVRTMGNTAHIDTIFKFLPHTRQHECFLLAQTPSFSKLFIPHTNGLVCRRVLCVLCTKHMLHSNHRLTRVIFQHTKLLPRSGRFLTTYTHIA